MMSMGVLPLARGSASGRGGGSGLQRSGDGVLGGRGQGTNQSSCHILHYHMVLRPEGTSHNETHQESRFIPV